MNEGVYLNDTTGKWVSCITKDEKLFFGEYETFPEALVQYQDMCLELFGDTEEV